MLKYVAKRFLRAELAKFLPNARLVAEFEKLSQDVVETIPANIEQTVQAALLSNTPAMAARVEDAETRILALESAPRVVAEDISARVQALELTPRVVAFDEPVDSVSMRSTTINVGTTAVYEAVVVVTDSDVTPASIVTASIAGPMPPSKDADELEFDRLILHAVADSGQFTLYVEAVPGPVSGQFPIAYGVA